jgi:hypothetical protein
LRGAGVAAVKNQAADRQAGIGDESGRPLRADFGDPVAPQADSGEASGGAAANRLLQRPVPGGGLKCACRWA